MQLYFIKFGYKQWNLLGNLTENTDCKIDNYTIFETFKSNN